MFASDETAKLSSDIDDNARGDNVEDTETVHQIIDLNPDQILNDENALDSTDVELSHSG